MSQSTPSDPQTKPAFPLGFWFIWSLAAAVVVYVWPSFFLDMRVWEVSYPVPKLMRLATLFYLAGAVVIGYEGRKNRTSSYLIIVTAAGGVAALFAFYAQRKGLRPLLAVGSLVVIPTLLVAGYCLGRMFRPGFRNIVGAALVILSVAAIGAVALNPGHFLQGFRDVRLALIAKLKGGKTLPKNGDIVENIRSAYYPLKLTHVRREAVANAVPGGGLSRIEGDTFLLCTGEGKLFLCKGLDQPDKVEVSPLAFSVPIDRQIFIDEAKSQVFILHAWFRVASAFVLKEGDNTAIFTIYHHWKSDEKKYYVRLAVTRLPTADLLAGKGSPKWEVVWESTPGLPVHLIPKPGKLPFAGLQIGGRIAEFDANTLIFTIGDHEFDGVNADEDYPQDPKASYGKTFLYDRKSGKVETFTLGNRNPQGLHIGSDGRIWETEHGPQGGDEINVLRKGHNYGWPLATIGTEYDEFAWPRAKSQGDHSNFTTPMYAFGKSIGASNLVEMRGDLFPVWRGQLMLGSLGAQTLFRVRLEENRVLSIEDIPLHMRIRDIKETPGGRLALWTDSSEIVLVEPAAQQKTKAPAAFAQCVVCHSAEKGAANKAGPALWGLATRGIAAQKDFAYSDALRARSGDWTAEKLNNFLQNPQQFAPGTTMASPGVADPAARDEVVKFLLQQK